MLPRTALGVATLVALGALPRAARAEEAPARPPTVDELGAWLDADPARADASRRVDAPEAPPPPPRRHGFVLEASLGALTHVGSMSHVSPTAPWFRGAFGWEPTKWLMLLAQGDVTPSNTSLASAPPDPRGYVLWGLSGALRFGVQPWTSVGLFAQGEIGVGRVTENVLSSYGFKDATDVSPYFGALLGVEWYQVSPHTALAVQGGARSYAQLLTRNVNDQGALAWIAAGALKHTF